MMTFAASIQAVRETLTRPVGEAAHKALRWAAPLAASAVLTASSAQANDKVVDQVTAYLNSVETISGEFRQIAPGNVITDGEYAIRRPGRMYFRYEPPSPVRVVADGFWVAVFDEEDDPSIDRYPLSETPLYLLLKEGVDLRKEQAVKKVEETDKLYRVTVFDPTGDTEGEILLVFDKSPMRLREWTVFDGQGAATKVVLRTADFNAKVDNALFVIETKEDEKGYKD